MMRLLFRFFAALLLAGTTGTVSAAVPGVGGACIGLIGCGQGSANVFALSVPQIGAFMINAAGALGVLFIVWAGFQMVLAMGNDGKISEQKNAVLYVLLGLGVAGMGQSIVSLVATQNFGQGNSAGDLPVNIIGYGVGILLVLFNVVLAIAIIIGGVRMLYAQGKSDEFNKGRTMIFWSIVGAIIVNLANALVQALVSLLA